ncbi:MAG TPA: MFS transporter [Patescibacteria group bacterium]|nr:MFS transporter [Patescibacteria group bacterium]
MLKSKLFKNYKFTALWISQILSQLTINILSFVILIHIFQETGSTIATSLLWIAYALPAVLFGPFAAAWTDLMEKRIVLMISNLLQSIVVFLFAILLYKKLIYLSYIVVFLYSLFNQFYVPAEAATLPVLVKDDDLPQANSFFFITQQSSLVVGFGAAGLLDTVFGFRATLFLVSLCLFIAFVAVTFLPKLKPSAKLPTTFEKGVKKFFDQIVEGYEFIRNTKSVFFPFSLLLGVQVILTVIVTNLPRIATDIMKVSVNTSSLIVIVPAGIGAIIATLLISKFFKKHIKRKTVILSSLTLFAISILVVAIFIPFISLMWVRIAVAAIFFVVAGMGAVGTLVPSITYLQEETPKDLLGRVFGNFWFLTTLATVIPVLFSATITDLLGVRVLVILLGLICIGVVYLFRYEKL